MAEITDALEDSAWASRYDDAVLWNCGGVAGRHFGRELEGLGAALGSAVNAVERAGCKVARVDIEESPNDRIRSY